MSRTFTEEKTVYKFAELSAEAQERALAYFRESACEDSWWYESVYSDCAEIFDRLGIVSERVESWRNISMGKSGKRNVKPDIYFSGFWSQGDGASFVGSWHYKRGMLKAIRAYAPNDSELLAIASDLQEVQRKNFYRLTASISRTSHHYCHENTVAIDCEIDSPHGNREASESTENDTAQAMRRLMRWIYRALESEYDFQTSDSTIKENIDANEYEFDESGRLA